VAQEMPATMHQSVIQLMDVFILQNQMELLVMISTDVLRQTLATMEYALEEIL
jgi:hypothetical protein